MSTDVLRLPRINQYVTTSDIPRDRNSKRTKVFFPPLTESHNMSHRHKADHSRKGPSATVPATDSGRRQHTRQPMETRENSKRVKAATIYSQKGEFGDHRLPNTTGRARTMDSARHGGRGAQKSNDQSGTLTKKSGRDLVSLQHIARYRNTVLVYLDEGWKNTRKDRFYSTLEDAQVRQWKQKRFLALQSQKNFKESQARQLQQLRHIREKHQSDRTRRLSTQHVKWKYVINGKDGDRKEYGLPSEYFTYYGFNPNEGSPTDKRSKASSSKTAKSDSTWNASIRKERSELRRRNQARYEYLFATKRTTQLEMIQKMIHDGLYMLEMRDSEDDRPHDGKSSIQRASKGGTSTVVVKNVIDDAKRTLSNQENDIPLEMESDDEDTNDLEQ